MENVHVELLNLKRIEELDNWLKATNIKLVQVNGQRKYGGPPDAWDGPTPGARCEVFISQIPRDAYEDLLIPLFSSVGPLWEFRLMMNFSGQNRGFAYAKYSSPAEAHGAIQLLHGHELEPGFPLSVRRSTEKKHLCIEDLPSNTRQEELQQVLCTLIEGVERVSVKAGPGIKGVSAIVGFTSHHTASMAKKVLVEAFKRKFALTISLKWQSPVRPSQSKGLKVASPAPVKPPCQVPSTRQHPSVPPRLTRPSSVPLGFCRAVGGPAVHHHPPSPNHSFASQGHVVAPGSPSNPVTQLRKICEATGVGRPFFEIYYCDAGPDGYLYYNYKVSIPGIAMVFKGMVTILPGPTPIVLLEEAQQAAACQVLQSICSHISH